MAPRRFPEGPMRASKPYGKARFESLSKRALAVPFWSRLVGFLGQYGAFLGPSTWALGPLHMGPRVIYPSGVDLGLSWGVWVGRVVVNRKFRSRLVLGRPSPPPEEGPREAATPCDGSSPSPPPLFICWLLAAPAALIGA
eukprot:2928499-Pyramimonas_sp.AAC.1